MKYYNRLTISKRTQLLGVLAVAALWLQSCVTDPATNPQPLSYVSIIDTPYGTATQQKMDMYLPAGRSTASTKVIFLIHGGGWQAGDKNEMNVFVPLVRAQWPECAIVNINYRLANGTTVTADTIMNDVAAAIRFVTDRKSTLGVAESYGLVGASAGGQLALLYAYTRNSDGRIKCVADIYAPCVIDDWSWYNSFNLFLGKSVKEVLTTYNGKTWEQDSSSYHRNSPYTQLSASSGKPTIVFHGDADLVVPVYQSQWLSAKLKATGIPYEYHEYAFDGHGFNAANNVDCVQKFTAFFRKYL